MDIGAAQDLLGRVGRAQPASTCGLQPGADRAAVVRDLALPPTVQVADAQSAGERLTQISRAYRVNLTVPALVALFTGAYLVFSVLSLGVARRAPQLALLGVLGLTPGGRWRLVLAESALLGVVGTLIGMAGGLALAQLALRQLGGDLGRLLRGGQPDPAVDAARPAGLRRPGADRRAGGRLVAGTDGRPPAAGSHTQGSGTRWPSRAPPRANAPGAGRR